MESNAFESNPSVSNSNSLTQTDQRSMVDLHGLSITHAQQSVNWHLNAAAQTRTSAFRFVTGRGNHINSQGERGTLYREFPNWLSSDNLPKIASIKKGDGYYEISMKPTQEKKSLDLALEQFTQQWLIEHIHEVKERAEKGDAFYQYLLGHCYQYSIALEQNYAAAVAWYEKASQQNNAFAHYALGGCYWQGVGVRQHDQSAIELFKLAAAQGFAWAIHQLGDVYYYATGVDQDLALARDYYQQASELGLDLAKRKLGHIYFYGRGVKEDKKKGFNLYKEVADRGDPHSAFNVACAYLHGHGIEKNLELAFKYAKQAADGSDPDAQYLIAGLYYRGLGTTPCEALGLEYMHRAAANNFKHALFHLAYHANTTSSNQRNDYLLQAAKAGQIVAQAIVLGTFSPQALPQAERDMIAESFWEQTDEEVLAIPSDEFKMLVIDVYMMNEALIKKQKAKIVHLLTILADLDYSPALGRLGSLYWEGELLEKDTKKAVACWLKGATLGDQHCLCAMGYYYEAEAQTDASAYRKAFDYHAQAAKKGSANSCNQLGLLYKSGKGVQKDRSKAIEYFLEAMRLDSEAMKGKRRDGLFYNPVFPHAAFNLARLYGDGDEHFPKDEAQAVFWFIKAAEAGSEDAKKFINRIGISQTDEIYQLANKINFWKAPRTEPKAEKANLLNSLKEFAESLSLKITWKISKDDIAWCYITPAEVTHLKQYSLEPFMLRQTKDKRHILLLEKVSTYAISEVIANVKAKMKIPRLVIG